MMRIRSYVAIPEKKFCDLEESEFFLDISDTRVFIKIPETDKIINAYDIVSKNLVRFDADELVRPVDVTLTVERPSFLEPVEVCYGENLR